MGDQHESYSEMLEQSLNLRWPKKGDRLFKEAQTGSRALSFQTTSSPGMFISGKAT